MPSVSEIVMLTALWAAATYRIALSVRSETTVWRTAFTLCVLGVTIGTTSSIFGDQTIDHWSGLWNLAILVTHLALIGAAAAASVYLVTLRRQVVPKPALRARLAAGAGIAAVEIGAWAAAPIHERELRTTSEVNQSSTSGCVFALTYSLAIVVVTVEVACFCLSSAVSRIDITRTISLLLTGTACLAGAALFSAAAVVVLVRRLTGADTTAISENLDRLVPFVGTVLALGTLSLLFAPPAVDLVQSYLRLRSVRPLWNDLVQLRPEVHLDVPAAGGPLTRLHIRLHRAIVEIHDALRVTPVSVPATGGVHELAVALHRCGGSRTAAEVLAKARTPGTDDSDLLFALARSYSRTRP